MQKKLSKQLFQKIKYNNKWILLWCMHVLKCYFLNINVKETFENVILIKFVYYKFKKKKLPIVEETATDQPTQFSVRESVSGHN